MTSVWHIEDADLPRLDHLAQMLALFLAPGDVLALIGPLGAGKTTFARALISQAGGEGEVPSPTFALLQTYATPRLTLNHCDLYRLQAGEIGELGLDDVLAEGVLLLEWPERAGEWLPPSRLDISLEETASPELRRIVLTGRGAWKGRLERLQAVADFVAGTPFAQAGFRHLQGDASARSYARLVLPGRSAILMNSPRQPDGPPIRDGKPYSAIVHLAEDVAPFVAVDGALRGIGLSAPEIYAADLDRGFLVLEDLGDSVFGAEIARGRPMQELYEAATDVLLALAASPPPTTMRVEGHAPHRLPAYDEDAMLTEASLLVDWLWPALYGEPTPASVREAYLELWRPLIAEAAAYDRGWVLRDFHSPNLMWLPEREGIARVGLLDFQDALCGPLAYDLVSLLQDARLSVPETLEAPLLDRYCALRRQNEAAFSGDDFRAAYATLGAQRNSKILGIFARLAKRDGKRGYLVHLPRVASYLERDLAHPRLEELRAWYEETLPSADTLRSIHI